MTHRWHRLQTRFGMVAFPEKTPPARGILRCDPFTPPSVQLSVHRNTTLGSLELGRAGVEE
jgi:hypothetical protein